MVLDDNEGVRFLLKVLIEQRSNVKVIVAETGMEALELFQSHLDMGEPISFAVCDIKLPDMSGLDVATELREKHSLPLVMITAHDTTKIMEHARSRGFEVLSKSMGLKEIAEEVVGTLKSIGVGA